MDPYISWLPCITWMSAFMGLGTDVRGETNRALRMCEGLKAMISPIIIIELYFELCYLGCDLELLE
jgi:hypothetical protein